MTEWYSPGWAAKNHRVRQPLPREPLWTVWQGKDRIDASVLFFDDGAVEMQLFCNGTFFSGMRAYDRANAVVLANRCFGDYLDLGWSAIGRDV